MKSKKSKNQALLGKSSTLYLCLVMTSLLAEVLLKCFTWRVRGPKPVLILSRARDISQKPAFVLQIALEEASIITLLEAVRKYEGPEVCSGLCPSSTPSPVTRGPVASAMSFPPGLWLTSAGGIPGKL